MLAIGKQYAINLNDVVAVVTITSILERGKYYTTKEYGKDAIFSVGYGIVALEDTSKLESILAKKKEAKELYDATIASLNKEIISITV